MGKNKTKILLTSASILLLIMLSITITYNMGSTAVQVEADKNMISGDDEDHWHRIEATVKEIDTATKILVVRVSENDFFDSEEVQIDCSKRSVNIEEIQAGDQITIHFFKSSIAGNAVKAEDITL